METKRTAALIVALVMVFALSSVAFAAVASPTGSTVVQTSDNVRSVSTAPLPEAARIVLEQAANDFVAEEMGVDSVFEPLLAIYLAVQRSDNGAASITLNVAGVQIGDVVLVVIRNADGTIETVYAAVLENGVIELELEDFDGCDIVIGKIVPNGAAVSTNVAGSAVTMPMTGGGFSAAPMALLLVCCLAVMAVCGKALIKPE